MSGGSFNYLYSAYDLFPRIDDLERMASALAESHPQSRASLTTSLMLHHAKEIEALAGELSDVWLAVEWWQSGDHGKERVDQAVAKYEEAQ